MLKFNIQFYKILSIYFLSFFLSSGTKVENKPYSFNKNTLVGKYHLQSGSNYNNNFMGDIIFETAIKKTSSGKSFSILKLELKGDKYTTDHTMRFLISKENQTNKIRQGTYKVNKDIDGFLNYFDGVFGFANIKSMGELPLFAENGKIIISYVDDEVVEGIIQIDLYNKNKKSIHIEGAFIAKQITKINF